jgi:hypothetical protein
VRLPLLGHHGVHGDDSTARLAHSDRAVLAYQLPLPQLAVMALRRLAPDPFWTKLAFTLVGALVPVALAAVVGRLEGGSAAAVAGILAAAHPVLAYYSLVPYQEGPTLLLLLLGADARLAGRERRSALLVGLACLCRYEAWIAAALVVLRRPSRRSAVLFLSAPLGWMLLWRGLSPSGTSVLDLDLAAGRWQRFPYLLGKLSEYSGPTMFALGAAGAVVVLIRGDRRWRTAALFLTMVAATVLLFAPEFPAGTGAVSERLIHLPALALCATAAVLLSRLTARFVTMEPLLAAALAMATIGWSRHTSDLLAAAHRAPDLRLAMAVAELADRTLGTNGRLAVAAPGITASSIESYARNVEAVGGSAQAARATARELSRLTPDGVRIAAHLARPPDTVVPIGVPAALVAVYDDAPPTSIHGVVLARIDAAPRGVTIYAVGDAERLAATGP